MARLLITGGAGFIGANFVRRRQRLHPHDHLVVLDALTYAGNLHSVQALVDAGSIEFVRGDIGDELLVERLLREHCLDTIVHFAAESHVDRSITGPHAFVTTNINGTFALLQAARRVWLDGDGMPHRFHHVSTDEVFGSLPTAEDEPFSETTPYAPNSPYSASKAASDFLVRAYHRTYGLQSTISNCSNNYGPYQFPEKLIPLMITNALRGKALPVYRRGDNMRDWLHVEDHCAGIDAVLARGKVGESYNIGGNEERRNIDLVQMLCRMLDERLAGDAALHGRFPAAPPSHHGGSCGQLIEFVADRAGHDYRHAIDAGRMRRELAFTPQISFDQGMALTLDWYLANAPWWQAILDGTYREELPPLLRS